MKPISKKYSHSGDKYCLSVDIDGRIFYRYEAWGVGFNFTLFNEVGEPFQPIFRELLAELAAEMPGHHKVTRDDVAPYHVSDFWNARDRCNHDID